MPLGDDDDTTIVEESQLLHDHTHANTTAAHNTLCVVGEVPAQPLTLTQKIEKQQAAAAVVGGASSSCPTTPAPFGRVCSWSSTCAVVDEISDAEERHTPRLQQTACHHHTTASPAQHYRQSSEQPHLFYEDVDVLSCVGSAGSESPYHRDTFEESSVTSSMGAYYHYHHNHRRNSGPPPKEMEGTHTRCTMTATTTTAAVASTTARDNDAAARNVKATESGNTTNIDVVLGKKEELPVDCDYPLTSITTTKPDSASANITTLNSSASATKRVAVPVKYQGGSVPLVALMPVDPTAKYRKISRSFGTAAAFHVDFEALYRDHSAYVAALKLAAPKVRPSPFPFLHEMRMQRKKNSNKPTITTLSISSPTALTTTTPHTHSHHAPSTQPQSHRHHLNSRQHHNQVGRHHQQMTPTTPNSAAYAFYTRDHAPLPSSPSSGSTPPTYHLPQQQYHSLPTYHHHAAPTSAGHPHRPPTATSFF